jgi:hypothetical protein
MVANFALQMMARRVNSLVKRIPALLIARVPGSCGDLAVNLAALMVCDTAHSLCRSLLPMAVPHATSLTVTLNSRCATLTLIALLTAKVNGISGIFDVALLVAVGRILGPTL